MQTQLVSLKVGLIQGPWDRRGKHSVAKIWLETNGVPDVEIYESSLSTKENELLVKIIRENWEYIDQQLTKSFEGVKTEVKEITLKK